MQRVSISSFVLFASVFFIVSCSHSSGRNKRYLNSGEQPELDTSITILGIPDYDSSDSSYSIPTDSSIYRICIPRQDTYVSEQILKRSAYILSYNKDTKCPNWVTWHLTAEHVDGDVPRDNSYYEDEEVPTPRATNEDYHGSRWSRGHMCPAGDNKWDERAMRESNLLSNICPQDRSLNSGVWNKIEQDCRRWAKKYGDVYIVCGPIFLNREHETIGENKVVVPEAFFKVILCLQGKPKAIGFVIRNNEGKKKRDQFINTVDDVERITGYDFSPLFLTASKIW